MSTKLLLDGMLSGTGIRDAEKGGYLAPKAIGLSPSLTADVADWQRRYEDAHFAGFPASVIASLDEDGLDVWSRRLMVQQPRASGRKRYGAGSIRERHDERGRPSSDTA